eukprot:2274104-Pyramimonas_sp.AAC.1
MLFVFLSDGWCDSSHHEHAMDGKQNETLLPPPGPIHRTLKHFSPFRSRPRLRPRLQRIAVRSGGEVVRQLVGDWWEKP